MLHVARELVLGDESSAAENTAIAYRRTSIPQLIPGLSSTPPQHQYHNNLRRAPLAPLNPQGAHVPLHSPVPDDSMSRSASSPSFLGYAHGDPQQELDRPTDVAWYPGAKAISSTRMSIDEFPSAHLAPRRRSIPCHSYSNSTACRLPPSQQRRRPSHSSASASSTRRPSLPIIHLNQSTASSVSPIMSTVPVTGQFTLAPLSPGSEDLYSNLASFTFGTAAPHQKHDLLDTVSPFSTTSGTPNTDRTPRPSVSGRTRTPRAQPRHLEDDGHRADDEDEDEVARQTTRAKMRAIDDGTRRPSLPINSSGPSPTPNTSKVRASRSPSAEREIDHDDSDGFIEDGDILDTDVEFDDLHRGSSQDPEVPDTASYHTFGQHFNGNMNVDGGFMDEDLSSQDSVSPITFSAMYDSDTAESSVIITAPSQQRRGSLPWAIPGVPQDGTANRTREDSLATVIASGRRMSRSLTSDEHPLSQVSSAVQSTSEPSTRADWRTLEAQTRALQNEQQQLSEQDEGTFDDEEAGRQVYKNAGLDMSDIFDGSAVRKSWASGAPSYVQPGNSHDGAQRGPTSSWEFQGWGLPIGGGRRPSVMTTTTISGEDAFHRATNMNDPTYGARKIAWSFKCEASTPVPQPLSASASAPNAVVHSVSGAKGSRVGPQEIWKQDYVGRFKIDRMVMQPNDPSKAAQHRMNIRHIPDPNNKNNPRGGPITVIHRHSKAVGFSIFRKHSLYSRASSSGPGSYMNSRPGILLAPRRVQEQFTSTQSTRQLNAHGLLGEARSSESSRTLASSSRRESRSKDRKDRKKEKSKAKSYASDTGTASAGSTTTNDEMAVSHYPDEASSSRNQLASPITPSVTMSPTVMDHAYPPKHSASPSVVTAVSSTSSTFRSGRSPSPLEFAPTSSGSSLYSLVQSPSTTVHSPTTLVRSPQSGLPMRAFADPMVLDDDEQAYPRTSHAEAFATLDSNTIEYFRGRSEQRTLEDSSSLSNFERLRRRFLGQNNKATSRPPSGPPSAALEGHYTPPWLTMAPRSKQEERERVIQNLNDSFKDVGLLPSFRSNGKDRAKGKHPNKAPSAANVFTTISPDSLFMVLPLWPGETDAISAREEGPVVIPEIPLDERRYLIVFYIAFDERESARDKAKKADTNKKRARSEHVTAGAGLKQTETSPSFRACARLVTYDEFHGTGVRIPAEGLSVTGPMTEAMHLLPPDSSHHDAFDNVVIAYCPSRESGMEFVPEGLTKLGLCVPSAPPSPSPVDEDEREVFLTPIGRAVVEMAWLGWMAMTSFVSPSTT